MSDNSEQMLLVLTEMRDLMRLIAEPAIAQRDKKYREELRAIAGNALGKKAKAIVLMDGTRKQTDIVKECGINAGDLSVLVKKLNAASLLVDDPKQPKLAISIPANFFEMGEDAE
jgi:hypothetical protein